MSSTCARSTGSNLFQAGAIVPVAEIAPGAKGWLLGRNLYAGPQEQGSTLKQIGRASTWWSITAG